MQVIVLIHSTGVPTGNIVIKTDSDKIFFGNIRVVNLPKTEMIATLHIMFADSSWSSVMYLLKCFGVGYLLYPKTQSSTS